MIVAVCCCICESCALIFLVYNVLKAKEEQSTMEGSSVEAYMSTLNMSADSKRKHRKAIREFQAMLEDMAKTGPDEEAYAKYAEKLSSEGKQEATVKGCVSHVRKYYAWLDVSRQGASKASPESESTGMNEGTTQTRPQRFSLMLPGSLREQLGLLAMYDGCTITDLVIRFCENGITARAGDVEYARNFARNVKERKAQSREV